MPQSIPEVIEEWRRLSTPTWRRIYRESLSQGDEHRAAYASWVLSCVLKTTIGPKEWESDK